MEIYNQLLAGVSAGMIVFGFVYAILCIIGLWKLFEKAGKSGWHSIIPFLNTYDLYEIGGLNGLLFLVGFIPVIGWIVALVFQIMAFIGISKGFGKSGAYAVLFILFTPIMYIIFGFNSDKFDKTKVKA